MLDNIEEELNVKKTKFEMKSKVIKMKRRAKVIQEFQLTAIINFSCSSAHKSNYWLKLVINKSKLNVLRQPRVQLAVCFCLFSCHSADDNRFKFHQSAVRRKVIKCTMHNLKISHGNQRLIACETMLKRVKSHAVS